MDSSRDPDLVARALRGEEKAYRALLDRYQRSVYSICLRMVKNETEAEDLAQEAFVKVFTSLGRYDPTYPFSSWIFKITANLCIDHLRKRRLQTVSIDEPVAGKDGDFTKDFPAPGANPEGLMLTREKMEALDAAIESLPPHYRIMVLLRHQEGLSYEEIAEALDIPLGTVKARIHRARALLKGMLEERGLL